MSDPIGERIVRAAAAAFISQGFAASSTLSIARAARTSKRAIYERFSGKDALFDAVMKYLCSQGGQDEQPAPRAEAPLADYLTAMAGAVLARFAVPEARGVLAAAVGAIPQFPSVVKAFWEQGPGQAATVIAAELRARHRRGEIPAGEFDELAIRFIHDCSGPIVLRQLFDESFTPSQADIDQSISAAIVKLCGSLHGQ